MDFNSIWLMVGAVVAALFPIITWLVSERGSDQAKERWGIAKMIIARIFGLATTRSTKTGKTKLSLPGGNPIHPDDR